MKNTFKEVSYIVHIKYLHVGFSKIIPYYDFEVTIYLSNKMMLKKRCKIEIQILDLLIEKTRTVKCRYIYNNDNNEL